MARNLAIRTLKDRSSLRRRISPMSRLRRGKRRTKPVSAESPAATGIAFLDRRRDQCAWIYGEAGPTARCCGAPVEEGAQLCFCPEHLARAFGRVYRDAAE